MTQQIMIATTSAVLTLDGKRAVITKGRTTARQGHPILLGREHMFRPLKVDYETGPEGAEHQTADEYDHTEQDDTGPGGEQDGNAVEPDSAEQETTGKAAGKPAAKPTAPGRAATSRSRVNG